MNKILLITILLLTSFYFLSCESNDNPLIQGTSNLKPNSKILVEYFTNITCVNCPEVSHYLTEIDSLRGVTINDTNVIILTVHTYLNTIDPFYKYNIPHNKARTDYYQSGLYNPINFLMGVQMPVFNAGTWTNLINQRLSEKNTFVINTINSFDSASKTGQLTLTLGQLSGTAVTDLKLHAAITESNILFNAPNGEKIHHNIMRKLISPVDGADISLISGQSINYILDYTSPSNINLNNCKIVVFLQSQESKKVYAADKVKLVE